MIRPERPEDRPAVEAVHRAAFDPADAALAALGPAPADDPASPSISLVYEWKGSIVGHLWIGPIDLPGPSRPPGAAVGPLAIRPSHQGLGLGTQLMREGLMAALAHGAVAAVALGRPGFFGRFRFAPAADYDLSCALEDADPDAFRVLELVEGGLDGCSGAVAYPGVFATDAGADDAE